MGKAYIKAAQEEGVATSVKHFPGDGVDERDQHLLTSVNSLSCEEWDKTYGDRGTFSQYIIAWRNWFYPDIWTGRHCLKKMV